MKPVTLIEPIDVEIEQINIDSTPFPSGISGRKFPSNNVVRNSKLTIEAQVVHGNVNQQTNFTQMGADEQVKGYLVLRYKDLTDLGITLKRGDKIIKMGQLDCELFLSHSSGDPAAHIGGGFKLVRMFFQDRKPVGE